MTAEEKIKAWKDDSADHAVIYAHDWSPESDGVKRICEGCGREISVWPVVARKALENPRFHVLCKSRCLAVAIKVNGPLRFGGRITHNTLPDELEKMP